MTQPLASLDVKDLKDVTAGGLVREDVLNKIYGTDKRGTPFLDVVGTDSFSNNYSEWTEEDLINANSDNAFSSGTDYTPTTSAHGARLGNHAQIIRRGVNVTDRAQELNKVGRSDELGYETSYQLIGLRYDKEAIALGRNASVADNPGTTVGKTAGLDSWIKTNTDNGAGGSDGGFNTSTKEVDAPTAGSGRALSWEMIGDQIENTYLIGCKPTILFTVPALRKRIGQYLVTTSKAAQLTANVSGTSGQEMVSNQFVDSFKTDFGYVMRLQDSVHMETYELPGFGGSPQPVGVGSPVEGATVFGIDPEYIKIASLYGVRVKPLSVDGDYVRKMIQEDWMTKVTLERAHFAIRDIVPTVAVTD